MNQDLTKKAAEMLIKGATLLKEPCPYCNGVRVMKDGNALCVSCGREPEQKEEPPTQETKSTSTLENLQIKLEKLTQELLEEKDHQRQQEIIKSIDSLTNLINKIKSNQ